jgi:N-acetyl-anhydromuramyl-L-alanine amidase AmpD
VQYDFTPEQYAALSHLVAALCAVLPEIQCEAPRDAEGRVPSRKLGDEALASFQGVLGHHHITERKVDPGPAFDWDKVMGEARRLLGRSQPEPNASR